MFFFATSSNTRLVTETVTSFYSKECNEEQNENEASKKLKLSKYGSILDLLLEAKLSDKVPTIDFSGKSMEIKMEFRSFVSQ